MRLRTGRTANGEGASPMGKQGPLGSTARPRGKANSESKHGRRHDGAYQLARMWATDGAL